MFNAAFFLVKGVHQGVSLLLMRQENTCLSPTKQGWNEEEVKA